MTTHSGSPGEQGYLLGGCTLRYAQALPPCAAIASAPDRLTFTVGMQNLSKAGIHPWLSHYA